MNKKLILKKTAQVGLLTLLSRVLGVIREMLLVSFLGAPGALTDAFLVAFRMPNSLRKIFAEGALTAAFVPAMIGMTAKGDGEQTRSFMTVSFLFFESIVLILCVVAWWYADALILLTAGGFGPHQLVLASTFLRILFPLLLFISCNALFAGALQSVNHFVVPALGAPVLNLAFIITLIVCLAYELSVPMLCYGILIGAIINFFMHLAAYFWYGFGFEGINKAALKEFSVVARRFLGGFFGVSIMEINLFADQYIGSYLPSGSVTLLNYGTRFMQIPLSVAAIAFSTILLSHFSRVALYAPKRLNYYLLEASKFVTWLMLPASVLLILVSEKLFSTILLVNKATPLQIWRVSWVLTIMATGLIFFSLNKVLTSAFYALHDTWRPTIAGIVATLTNICINILSIKYLGEYALFGIACATVASGIMLSAISMLLLYKRYGLHFYFGSYLLFLLRYIPQLLVGVALLVTIHLGLAAFFSHTAWYAFLFEQWGYWLVMIPLSLCLGLFLWASMRVFKIKLYFVPESR